MGRGSALETARLLDLPGRGLVLQIVAVKRQGESTRFQPSAEERLRAGDRVVVVGDAENLRRVADLAVGG